MRFGTFPWVVLFAMVPVGVAGCRATEQPSARVRAGSPSGGRQDPQASYEPRSDPGEGQQYLARFVGHWTVVKTFYPRSGDPVVTKGRCTQKMIHAGRFLESDFVFEDPGPATTGMGIIGYDAATGRFTSFWTDSRSTRISIRGSEGPFDGHQIVLFSRTLDDPGTARRSRTVSFLEDGGRKLIHRQYTDTPGSEPRLVMQLELTKTR